MRRRTFTALMASVVGWPIVARTQQPDPQRRVGVLMSYTPDDGEDQARAHAFDEALRQLGWMPERNMKIDYHWAMGDRTRARAAAADLVALGSEVVLATSTLTLAALHEVTRAVPIVFVNVTDPVGQGAVASLAHPGGNVTGFSNYEFSLGGKWLELLQEVSPGLNRVAVMQRPGHPAWMGWITLIEAKARPLGIKVIPLRSSDPAEFESALSDLAREPGAGLIVLPDPALGVHRDRIVALAARHRLPAVYSRRLWTDAGGLLSAGIDGVDQYRQAAAYVDRILKGDKPERLPVQQPTKLELVINLKAAKAINVEMPVSLLARADEVIE